MSDTSLGFNLIGRDVSASDALDKVARKAKSTGDDFDIVSKNMTGLSGGLTKSFLGVGAAIGGAFAVGNLASNFMDFMKDAAATAIEDEQSMVALKVAMDNLGLAAQNPAVEDWTKNLSLASGVADDQLRPALSRLLRSTQDVTESQQALEMALSISVATGKDVGTVANGLGKAYDGNAASLGRLGLGLDKALLKSGDMGAIMDELSKKFGGQWQAAAETYGGQLERLNVAADEAKETIGYALLGAINDVSDAFGGTEGATGAMTAMGDATANLVTGIGFMATEIAKLAATMQTSTDESTDWGDNFRNYAGWVGLAFPPLLAVAAQTEKVADLGAELADQKAKEAAIIAASADRYTGYAAQLRAVADPANQAAAEAEDLADTLQDVKDAFEELSKAISDSQSMDDFRFALHELDVTLKGNERSFDGWGKASKENRDVIRDSFSSAASIAQKWAEDNGKSAEQAQAYYDKLGQKIVAQFVKDGFKRKDAEAFLGQEGIWTAPAWSLMKAVGTKASIAAYASGHDMGRDLGLGTIKGLADQAPGVQAAAMRLIAQAEAAARQAAESHSPSQLFYRVGEDLGEGLKQGMAVVWPRIAGDINKGLDELTISIRGKSDEASGAMLESFAKRTDAFKSIIDAQVDKITTAKQALADYSAAVADTVLGGLKWQTIAPDGSEFNGEQIYQAMLGGIDNQNLIVEKLGQVVTKIPEALAQQMLTMDPKAAIALSDYLAANPAAIDKLNLNYAALAELTQTTLGVPMAQTFAMVGDVSATEMIAKAKERIREEAGDFRRWVRDHLGTTITVKVNYDTSGAPVGARAAGGPVTGGLPYLVGERGPELFVPGASGSIVPNGALTALPTGGGGTTIVVPVTVQGSVISEQDLVTTIQDGLAMRLRRRGLDPSVLGV